MFLIFLLVTSTSCSLEELMPDLAVGSETGAILSLAIDPLRPTTVYAGTQGGGVFNTVDGGKRWSASGKIL